MKRDPLASVATGAMTSQRRPMPGVANQIKNSAGGYVFDKDLWTKVEDFLILGTSGGTYYISEDKLTEKNTEIVFKAAKQDGVRLVKMITDIATSRPSRAPKPRPYLFALAAARALGDADTRQAVKDNFAEIVRTTDHLSMFFGYWKNLAGKTNKRGGKSPVIGRSMRTTLGSFFTEGSVHDVAYKSLKARQRSTPQGEAMALADVLRVAHPPVTELDRKALLGWLAGRVTDEQARREVADIDNFLVAQSVKNAREAVRVVTDRRVPWEFLPSDVLKDKDVWDALIDTIGMTALIRNLKRMTMNGTLAPFAKANDRVAARLTNGEALVKARVHPMDAYLALRTYGSGRTVREIKGKAPKIDTWTPVPAIVDALEQAWELSFGSVEPSGRRLLVAVDSSGSMGGAQVSASGAVYGSSYNVASSMALILSKIEKGNVHCIDVDTSVHASKITPNMSLRDLVWRHHGGGGTDMALPYRHARTASLNVDGVVILSDNETWAGYSHPQQELAAYRQAVNPAVRTVSVSMYPNMYGLFDHTEESVLQVAGLDAALPKLITGFVRVPEARETVARVRARYGAALDEIAEFDE